MLLKLKPVTQRIIIIIGSIIISSIGIIFILKALNDNIQKFESQHGSIKDIDPSSGIPMNFGGPKPLA